MTASSRTAPASPRDAAADLADWTPVALDVTAAVPSVDWADLRGVRFAEPFFQQTVERWAGGDPQPLVRTGLDALAALDTAPSLDPALFVFHLSRCGSTLVSRLLSRVPGTLVISEPGPLNTLLLSGPAAIAEAALVPLLRALVRALGRRRFDDERRYVLKLSSWNVRRIGLFRRAFPDVPVVWVQRAPDEVMASLLAAPPGWAALQRLPRELRSVFGLEPEDAAGDDATFFAAALAAMLRAISDDAGPALVLDYRALPDALWSRVAPLIGLDLDDDAIASLRDEARFDSKSAGRRLFVRSDARSDLAEPVRRLVTERLATLYETVARRPSGVPGRHEEGGKR